MKLTPLNFYIYNPLLAFMNIPSFSISLSISLRRLSAVSHGRATTYPRRGFAPRLPLPPHRPGAHRFLPDKEDHQPRLLRRRHRRS